MAKTKPIVKKWARKLNKRVRGVLKKMQAHEAKLWAGTESESALWLLIAEIAQRNRKDK